MVRLDDVVAYVGTHSLSALAGLETLGISKLLVLVIQGPIHLFMVLNTVKVCM